MRHVATGGSAIDPQIVARLVRARQHRHDGLDNLSPRERDVLALMAEGKSNNGIARRLYLTDRTVEAHVRSIFTKLNLTPEPDDHRRVMAVIADLRSTPADSQSQQGQQLTRRRAQPRQTTTASALDFGNRHVEYRAGDPDLVAVRVDDGEVAQAVLPVADIADARDVAPA